MSKEHIHSICKRIEENKHTEEELCYLRDLAIRGLTTLRSEGREMAVDVELLAIQAVCPINRQPITQTEKSLVRTFTEFGKQVVQAMLTAAPTAPNRDAEAIKHLRAILTSSDSRAEYQAHKAAGEWLMERDTALAAEQERGKREAL